ncbi:MAG: TolC family protein [Victivallales bacterium]|nr:TolC family protein [Victivallales bacterium]
MNWHWLSNWSGRLFAAALLATAAVVAGDALTLAECERLALGHNDRIAAANESWEAERARIDSAGALPDPQLGFTYYVEEVQTRVGPQEQAISLNQMIPWPAKLSAKRREQAEWSEAARHRFQGTRLDVLFRVRTFWYELAYIGRARERVRANVELLRSVEEAMRAQYRTGSGTLAKVLSLQLERSHTEDRLKVLDSREKRLLASLNETLGRDPHLPLARKGDHTPAPLPSPDDLRAAVLTANPKLLAAQRAAAAGAAGLDYARATNRPDFTVGASWVMTGDRTDMDVSGNGRDPVLLSVRMTLPIWPAKNRAVRAQAAARRRALESTSRDTRQRLLAKLEVLLVRHNEAIRQENLYRKTLIPQAEQAYASLRKSFAAGQVSFANLIDSQRRLLELQLQTEKAVLEKHQTSAAVHVMRGEHEGAQPSADKKTTP